MSKTKWKVIAIGPNTWGAGDTITEAVDKARENWNRTRFGVATLPKFSIYVTDDPYAIVSEMGGIVRLSSATVQEIQTSSLARK